MHEGVLVCGFFSTARTASWNTSCRFDFFLAEHSINEYARILFFNFLASDDVTNFSEFGMRRSLFVPTKEEKNGCNNNILIIEQTRKEKKYLQCFSLTNKYDWNIGWEMSNFRKPFGLHIVKWCSAGDGIAQQKTVGLNWRKIKWKILNNNVEHRLLSLFWWLRTYIWIAERT